MIEAGASASLDSECYLFEKHATVKWKPVGKAGEVDGDRLDVALTHFSHTASPDLTGSQQKINTFSPWDLQFV